MRRLPAGNGQIYSYYFRRVTHTQALGACRMANSDLLVIDSQSIQETVNRHLLTIGTIPIPPGWLELDRGYWTRGRVYAGLQWSWRIGQTIPVIPGQLGYQNWYRPSLNPLLYQPSPPGTSRPFGSNCLYISGLGTSPLYPNILGSWFDAQCVDRKYYICESRQVQISK